MFCTRCGAKVDDGMKFCTSCGAPMGAADEAVSSAPVPAPTATVQMPRVAPSVGAGSTAPSSAPLPPSIPQDDILYQAPKKARKGVSVVAVVAACIVVFVLAGVGVWFGMGLLNGGAAEDADETVEDVTPAPDDAKTDDDGPSRTSLTLTSTALVTSSYPQVSVDMDVEGASADELATLTAADFTVEETTPDGGEREAQVSRVSVSDEGDSLRIVYESDLGGGITRTARISLDEMSGFSGSASVSFTAPTEDDEEDGDYVLSDSATHRYSTSELEDLSNWELYIARNEIYARHGRRFQNDDLQSYFDGQDWYEPRYSPQEFDANVTLSDVELANAETIRSLEQSRGSSYL